MSDYDDDHEGHGRRGSSTSGAGRKNRHRPFASVLLVGLLAVPVLALILRFLIALDPNVLGLTIGLVALIFGAGGVLFALGVGKKVTGRLPFIYWHVALTIALAALWMCTTLGLSWENIGGNGWRRLLDVPVLPVTWWVIHIVGSLALASSWLLYRIDALRAAAAPGSTGAGSWKELFGVKGVTPVMAEATADEDAIRVPISHPGVPLDDFRQRAIKHINDQPGVVAGGTTIVRDGKMGGRSVLTVPLREALETWHPWPGLSHPGGPYEAPINTAKYSDGSLQWYAFAKTPKGMTFAKAPGFASPSATFVGRQGMTGSGKSGDAGIETAEILSRRRTVVIYIDNAKLYQNASWCLPFLTLASGSEAKTNLLFAKLEELGQLRSREIAGRDFSTKIAEQTGFPWVHIFADEFDVVSQGRALDWLLSKGRSLGFRFSFTLPRATGANMGTDIRGQIGTWKQFGITQDYDKGFVLSAATMEAGANPEKWKATLPGAHYLDGAPGVPESRWAVDSRAYQTEEDYSDLAAAVAAARRTFTPATFRDDELAVLGEVMQICHPSRANDNPRPDQQKGTPDMQTTLNLSDYGSPEPAGTGDPELDALLAAAPDTDTTYLKHMVGDINPREPIPVPMEDVGAGKVDLTEGDTKPRPDSPQHAIAELEAALLRMAARGVTEFGNKDLMAEMRVRMSGATVSNRLTELCDGDPLTRKVNPPEGWTVARMGPGRFHMRRL